VSSGTAVISARGESVMKILIATFAVTLALPFTGPAFIGPAFAGMAKTAKTESDCRMADGHWDKMTKRCKEKKM
jgi:hypothetical protein